MASDLILKEKVQLLPHFKKKKAFTAPLQN